MIEKCDNQGTPMFDNSRFAYGGGTGQERPPWVRRALTSTLPRLQAIALGGGQGDVFSILVTDNPCKPHCNPSCPHY